MAKLTDQKLIRLITYAPATLVALFTLIWVVVALHDHLTNITQEKHALHKEHSQQQRSILQNQVEYVAKQIQFAKERTEQQLQDTIQARIYEAHTIATRLYENNQHLPEADVTRLITAALRDIRFNQGRGYFFIYKSDGTNIMHPLLPHVEGTSLWDFKDVRGSYIVREMGEIVKAQGEAFYRWWFVKPDNKNKEFEKIGFGKYFAPYDWFIGTGDYVVDVEEDIQHTVLEWINALRFGEQGYVFVLDRHGEMLAHIDPDRVGTNALQTGSATERETTAHILNADRTIIHYDASYLPPGISSPAKTSYIIKIPGWDWSVGSGVYDEVSERFLNDRIEQAELAGRQTVAQLLVTGVLTTLVIALLSLGLSRLISRRFERFQARINADFDDLQETKDQMEYMALHDALTGLPNRTLLHDHIRTGITRSKDTGQQLAVMFVDLDDFKKINDLHGHSAGDKLLACIGQQFKTLLDPHDLVARFGGDEFIFCFPNLHNLKAAQQKVEAIRHVFKNPFSIDGKVLFTSCTVGVSMFPADGEEPEDLIAKADIVLYKSKARQKGDVLFFDHTINQQVKHDFLLEQELRGALDRKEFYVVYQPQVYAATGQLHGVEALLRWNSAVLGQVPPDEFIPVAEEIGIIDALGDFVLDSACHEIGALFPPTTPHSISLSVNLSPLQLTSPVFSHHLEQTLLRHHWPASLITLEITESVLIDDLPKVTPLIEALCAKGFSVSLDDFGTGYSSLSYLSHLPINEIKIDKLFVSKMLSTQQSDSLVKAVIAIASSSHMRVVAEGVETELQQETLMRYGCDLLQGYFIDKPLSAQQLKQKYAHPQ